MAGNKEGEAPTPAEPRTPILPHRLGGLALTVVGATGIAFIARNHNQVRQSVFKGFSQQRSNYKANEYRKKMEALRLQREENEGRNHRRCNQSGGIRHRKADGFQRQDNQRGS